MSLRVVVATSNPGKLQEIGRLLADLDVDLVAMSELGIVAVEETGASFEENALAKARTVARETGLATIADDSGLEVDALGGEPGVRSARYAGTGASDEANVRKLLAAMRTVALEERSARFVAVAALAAPDGREWTATGVMEGHVTLEPRGGRGFGYDPVFVCTGEARTNAELTAAEKDARSHRGAAFRSLRPAVVELLAAAR